MMVGAIIIICRYSVRISKLFGNSDPEAVLATIVLLSYNTLVQNIITILTAAHLNKLSPDGSTTGGISVWRYNGEVGFGTGYHIALIVVVLGFLVFLFLHSR